MFFCFLNQVQDKKNVLYLKTKQNKTKTLKKPIIKI